MMTLKRTCGRDRADAEQFESFARLISASSYSPCGSDPKTFQECMSLYEGTLSPPRRRRLHAEGSGSSQGRGSL